VLGEPRTVAEVLVRVRAGWADLGATFADLDASRLSAPGPEGWSVKDHLVHLMTWENVVLTILAHRPQHFAFDLDADTYDRIDSVDQLNAIIYERARDRSLEDVLAQLDQVHADLETALGRLSDADLERTVADIGSDTDDQRLLLAKIEGDTYGHYAEHVAWLCEVREFVLERAT